MEIEKEIINIEETKKNNNNNQIELKGEIIKIIINFKKQNFEIEIGLDNNVGEIKKKIEELTGVSVKLQKLMYKGF